LISVFQYLLIHERLKGTHMSNMYDYELARNSHGRLLCNIVFVVVIRCQYTLDPPDR
jgi:hypothetical protein